MRLIDRVQLVIQSLGAWIDVLEGLTDQLERLVKILERLGRVIFRVARLGSAVIFMLGIIVMRLSGVL
jgi:hypothetical protein